MATVTYITYLFPFAEDSSKRVKSRRLPKILPKGCVAFYFSDRQEVIKGKELLKGVRKNLSPRHFVGKFTLAKDVPAQYPGEKHRILRDNVESNKFFGIVNVGSAIWEADKADVIHTKEEFTFGK